jgi:hypothetical protein
VVQALPAMDGYAWLAQALHVPAAGPAGDAFACSNTLLPALGVAALLIGVARPAAVWMCLRPLSLHAPRDLVHRLGRPARRGAGRAGAVSDDGRPAAGASCCSTLPSWWC